jgi:CRISPR/Cas system-associated endonuclease Cas1
MKPLLLTTYGSCLKTQDRKLVLWNQDSGARKEWSPAEFGYDSVITENLGGFVTFPALRWLATNGVSLTMLDFDGRPTLSCLSDRPTSTKNRLAQIAAFMDRTTRVNVARFVLESKLGRPVPPTLRNVPDLLMHEATEASRDWASLGITRDYPHARDPANACLNYAYGLLESRARLACHRAGLEETIGFLHTPQDSKDALVYDVMEPMRASVTATALKVRRALTSRDFGEVFGHGLKLRPEAARRLVREFARTFDEEALSAFVAELIRQFDEAPAASSVSAAEEEAPKSRAALIGTPRPIPARAAERPVASIPTLAVTNARRACPPSAVRPKREYTRRAAEIEFVVD